MCGIAGIISFKAPLTDANISHLTNAIDTLQLRGPDFRTTKKVTENVAFAHARLSIIDTSDHANQPLSIENENFTIIFNGEIFNYKTLRDQLIKQKGERFATASDTEVILKLYKHYGKACINKLNGFFAFAIFDKKNDSVLIARDRIGIKPLLYYYNKQNLFFASEMKAMMQFPIPKEIDKLSLKQYFQFNYIPSPNTIFQEVKKLQPGQLIEISNNKLTKENYYTIPIPKNYSSLKYSEAQVKLKEILTESVEKRMVADVPLGSYLSGGIDSSIIATLAARMKPDLNTFSIGFKNQPYFDETHYANLVARRIKSNHTVFSLTNEDLFENLYDILDYIDEPFADSSAIPVYILSKKTRQHVTVSLSGDGADELFGGYNKHFAEYKMRQKSITNSVVKSLNPLWEILPKSRHNKLGNLVRQLNRFAEGAKLSKGERYLRWCSFYAEENVNSLFTANYKSSDKDYAVRKQPVLDLFTSQGDLNEVLYADMHQVLVNDMLTKVDSMSMANSLEVRVPFLDHELVDFAFQQPSQYKVNKSGRKTILKDAFRDDLPEELYSRNKMGFEVPLLQWFQTDLKSLILDDLLEEHFIKEQGIFNYETIASMKMRLFSSNPGEVHAQIWALIVFQYWWKKYMV